MPEFIGVDGEGFTRPDGSHDYALLAASDGSYIEEYGPGGLPTETCFDYLLQLGARHKGKILVAFYASYDVNMMFRDLPEDVLRALWEGNTRTWRADSPDGHYRQYRLEYIPNRVFRLRRGWWYWNDEGRAEWHTVAAVTLWDCFQFFQMSFVKALKDWKVTDAATLANIEQMKSQRGSFDDANRDEIRSYCFDEVRLLSDMMGEVAASLEGLELRLTSWYGAGSIAAALFKKYGTAKHIARDWEPEIDDAVMRSYFGGRIETFGVGLVEDECMNYDIRSAYPAAIVSLPSLANCVVRKRDEYARDIPYALWHVKWARTTPNPIRLCPFPVRKDKRIFWPHTGEGWYHAVEVRAAIDARLPGIEIEVIEGYEFDPQTDEQPLRWIEEIYEARAEYKRAGDAREKPLKLGMNSGYGKFAQSIGGKDGKPPPFQCYYWAGMITADCRARLLTAAALDPENVLAIATDGLFTKRPIEGLELGERLGDWECTEVEAGLLLIQPGVYASPKLGKTPNSFAKSRGFGNAGLKYDALLAEWRRARMAAEVVIEETRFIGFGYALAVNKLSTLWRRWITGEKRIHFSGTTSKSFDPRVDSNSEFMPLVAPGFIVELSEPYVPRTRSKEDAAEYELQAEALAAMPDLDDNLFTWR